MSFPSLSPFCFIAKFTCGSATLLRGVVTVTGDGTMVLGRISMFG
ncbi:MAG: hypothetical protein U0T81_14415 [Saprospiraceae bacterium]